MTIIDAAKEQVTKNTEIENQDAYNGIDSAIGDLVDRIYLHVPKLEKGNWAYDKLMDSMATIYEIRDVFDTDEDDD